MRVLHLIDSLRPGGAEKMAVSYANALAVRIEASFLCCTRTEGLLKKDLSSEVGYLFLEKKHAFDLRAFLKLKQFVKNNRIVLIHAHSSSWFLAMLVKLSLPNLKLVWHDHYGKDLRKRKTVVLQLASKAFDGVISVNKPLKEWAEKNLYSSRNIFLNNFLPSVGAFENSLSLKGDSAINIICVANFRPQKDHLNLLAAFKEVLQENKNISLHLVGQYQDDAYSRMIFHYLRLNDLEDHVYVYREQSAIEDLISQADLGILSSVSEGLPVILLEYARAGLPVICTAVGEIPEVVGDLGRLVPPEDPAKLAKAIADHFINPDEGVKMASALREKILANFSETAVMPKVLEFYNDLIGGK